ncbi:MAG: hypothetical protein ABW221_06820 [Vicinamibacteria bacterium]
MRRTAATVVFCALSALAASAEAREMHWKSLDVNARLDAQGVLHVRERQHMVMTGDWNGGERRFRLEPTQDLELHAMRRIDLATGAVHEMTEGGLDEVDRYALASGNVLRWRSRLPSEPAFDHTERVYELDYTLYGVPQRDGDAFRVAHDFAFTERAGPIESHTIALAIDPAWTVDGPRDLRIQAGRLAPGVGYVVRLALRPGAGARGASLSPYRKRLLLALGLVAALLLLHLFVGEWIRGRFAPLDPDGAMRSLDTDLLAHRAEVVGAVWDRSVGPDEVGALVARLASEGTIRTSVSEDGDLEMELLVPRERLDGYERALVDGLFFDDRTQTSTADVRERYERTGFDPVARIRPGVEALADALVGPPALRLPYWLATLLCLGGSVAAIGSFEGRSQGFPATVLVLLPLLVIACFGMVAARRWRLRIDRGLLDAWSFVVPIALLLGLAAEWVVGFRHLPFLANQSWLTGGSPHGRMLGAVLGALAFTNGIVNRARSRERRQGIALRRRLASARRYFQKEFGQPAPALRDEWFPYVLALGLDADSQRWFRSFGGAGSGHSSGTPWSGPSDSSFDTSSSRGSSSSGSSTSAWSGGGGAFGGAGATASWAAAAGALSAGVATPSSSGSSGSSDSGGSSSSDGGGGDSSSGGGGGGGW